MFSLSGLLHVQSGTDNYNHFDFRDRKKHVNGEQTTSARHNAVPSIQFSGVLGYREKRKKNMFKLNETFYVKYSVVKYFSTFTLHEK